MQTGDAISSISPAEKSTRGFLSILERHDVIGILVRGNQVSAGRVKPEEARRPAHGRDVAGRGQLARGIDGEMAMLLWFRLEAYRNLPFG